MATGTCPACGEATIDGARFCEACGHELAEVAAASEVTGLPPCVSCGAAGTEIDGGYCLVCGHRQPGPRDHFEIDLGWVAGVTDRGRRHRHNEDAVALATHPGGSAVAVVCDGVSTTESPEAASEAAADAALAVLLAAVDDSGGPDDLERAMREAVRAAQDAVAAIPFGEGADGSPSSTIVAAVTSPTPSGTAVVVGWLGDSRAYWLGGPGQRLTTDHNVGNGGVLTRWLGRDAPDATPDLVRVDIAGPGTVLLCSDGLWQHAATPAELAALEAFAHERLADRARALVDFANGAGGQDNITVALIDPGAGTVATPRDGGP